MAFCLLATGTAGAQHYVGIRAGAGSGSYRVYPPQETGSVWGLYSGGVSWKYYTDEKFVGGIEVDALWMQQGYRRFHTQRIPDSEQTERTGYYQRTMDVIMVPIMWQPHVYMFKQRLRVFLNAGVTFSYVLGSTQKEVSYVNDTSVSGKYDMMAIRDNRAGYGLTGGGGISWSAGRLEIFIDARYYIGYSDILKNRNKYEENPLRSPLDGMQFQAGIYWRLGKGGIRSEQGRGVTNEMIRNITSNGQEASVEEEEEVGETTPDGTVIEAASLTEEVAAGGENAAEPAKTKRQARRERRRE